MDISNATVAVLDIETQLIPKEGLSFIDDIYCISVAMIINGKPTLAEVYTNVWTPYSKGSIGEAVALINTADYMSFHNGVGFDVPVIENVTGIKLKPRPLDTLILSKIIFSKDYLMSIDPGLGLDKSLWGKYSLKAFGERMGGDSKIEFEDFSGLTEEMAIYCNRDTDLAVNFLLFLLEQDNFPLDKVVEIEHETAAIIQEQTHFGFYIDIDKANELNNDLLAEKLDLHTKLTSIFDPKFLPDGKVKTYKKLSISRKFLPDNNYVKLLGTP